jgi:2'-5' RNA ligase
MGGIIAIMFRSVTIASRHREFRIAGVGWEHCDFRPHVTIAIDDRRELDGVVPFAGDLVFSREIWFP